MESGTYTVMHSNPEERYESRELTYRSVRGWGSDYLLPRSTPLWCAYFVADPGHNLIQNSTTPGIISAKGLDGY